MGIIIEDDIFPSKSFLLLSEISLRDHKKDKSIFQISGTGVLNILLINLYNFIIILIPN